MSKRVLIVGCGEIGSRHLQAVCALPEVAGNAARTVDPLSVDAIAAALWASLTDNTTLARVREGLGAVAKYSWERTGVEVRRVIESCLRE